MIVTLLGRCAITYGNQQIASHPMQISIVASFLSRFNDLLSFSEAVQSFQGPAETIVGFRKFDEQILRRYNAPGFTQRGKRSGEQRETFLCLPKRGQRPSAAGQCPTERQRKPLLG